MEQSDIDRIDKYYTLTINPKDPSDVGIKIATGLFKDTVIKYGKLKIDHHEGSDDVSAKYEYEFIETPEHLQQSTISNEEGEEFEFMVGEILMKILYEHYQENSGDDNIVIAS